MVKKILFLVLLFLTAAPHVQAQEITQEEYNRLYSMAAPEEDGNALCKDLTEYPECVAEASMFRYYAWPEKGPEADTEYNRRVWIYYKFISNKSLSKHEIPIAYKDRWQENDNLVFVSELICADTTGCGVRSRKKTKAENITSRCPKSTCFPRGIAIKDSIKTCPFIAVVRKHEQEWKLIDRFPSDAEDSCSSQWKNVLPISQLPW